MAVDHVWVGDCSAGRRAGRSRARPSASSESGSTSWTQPTDPRQDLIEVIGTLRGFVVDHPALGQLMFSRPFADFDPGPRERSAGDKTRQFITARVRRCIDAGIFTGDVTDIAHIVLGLARGLASQARASCWPGGAAQAISPQRPAA